MAMSFALFSTQRWYNYHDWHQNLFCKVYIYIHLWPNVLNVTATSWVSIQHPCCSVTFCDILCKARVKIIDHRIPSLKNNLIEKRALRSISLTTLQLAMVAPWSLTIQMRAQMAAYLQVPVNQINVNMSSTTIGVKLSLILWLSPGLHFWAQMQVTLLSSPHSLILIGPTRNHSMKKRSDEQGSESRWRMRGMRQCNVQKKIPR